MLSDIDPELLEDGDEKESLLVAKSLLIDHEEIVMRRANAHTTLEGKIEFLNGLRISRLNDIGKFYRLDTIDHDFSYHWISNPLGITQIDPLHRADAASACSLSAEWLQMKIRELEILKAASSEDSRGANKMTATQTALAFYFGMLELGFEPRKAETGSVATFARFLHLLTGKEFTSLQNSDFYDKLKKAPNVITDPYKLLFELNTIRLKLQDMGFTKAVASIDIEIRRTQAQIEETRSGQKQSK